MNDQGGCGFSINSDDAANIEITNFEAHDFNIPLPAALRIGGPFAAEGSTTVATEDFAGVTADLDGKVTTTGALTWRAEEGRIDLDGSGSAIWVSGDPIYTIPWSSPGFADLQAEITPPGAGYGAGDNCFAGLVCFEDADNWIASRIRVGDDQVNSSEVEIIYCLAASSSVVSRIAMQTELAHGDQDTFRITFNGIDFNAYVDGEVVAYRSLTDLNPAYTALTINRVGIYADSIDNGSLWDNFIAKS